MDTPQTKTAQQLLEEHLQQLFEGPDGKALQAAIGRRLRGETGRVPLMVNLDDACPCGSEKKYAACCHAKVRELRTLVFNAKVEARRERREREARERREVFERLEKYRG